MGGNDHFRRRLATIGAGLIKGPVSRPSRAAHIQDKSQSGTTVAVTAAERRKSMLISRHARSANRASLILASVVLICSLAWSESNVGEISGQVSDPTGAAVPGCIVTATHTQTGLKRSVATQENGIFVFAALPEGKYNVVAE